MNKTVTEILKAWYLAHKQAENNSKILLMTTKEIDFGELCAARMSVVFIADKLLYGIGYPMTPNENYPHELIRHLEAKRNESNCICGAYSVRSKKHPECIEKSKEFFVSQGLLMHYIENNLINK